MRFTNTTPIDTISYNLNTTSIAIDASQLIGGSFLASFSDTQATGTFTIQASNDLGTPYVLGLPNPTNWQLIPNMTASITSGASSLLLPWANNGAYRWLRATYTSTLAGVQTIALVADVAGSLNSTYFLLQDEASVHKYYVWFNINSAGVDPAIPGRTGVPITGATGASAATLGTAVASAIGALNSSASFTTSGTSTVTVTNKTAGPYVAMTDGAAPTHFTFAVTSGTGTVTVNMNAVGF
jgi:hypothetical protein